MCATHGRGGTAAADDLQEPVNVAGRLLLCSSPKLVSEGAFCTVILGKIKLTQSFFSLIFVYAAGSNKEWFPAWEVPSMALRVKAVGSALWGISNLSSLGYVVKLRAGTGIQDVWAAASAELVGP